jgi:hypothetical protein
MASRNATIAEAVKASLNTAAAGGAFGAAFVVRRVYVPGTTLEGLKGLTVTVYAAEDQRTHPARGVDQHDVVVHVGVQKRLTTAADPQTEAANAEIDALMEVAERIADHFKRGELGATGAMWASTDHAPTADPQHLLTHRVFTNLIVLTFRLWA